MNSEGGAPEDLLSVVDAGRVPWGRGDEREKTIKGESENKSEQ